MALPLVAGVKGAMAAKGGIGTKMTAGVRSEGASMMHSKSAGDRQIGSKMMKFDAGGKLAKNIDTAQSTITKISGIAGKILGTLEKHSPALKQQLVVIGKSISLFLRPIGDAIARWITPMARWMIKVAMKWYKWLGGGGADTDDPEQMADQLLREAESARLRGDDDLADDLEKQAQEIIDAMPTAWDKIKNSIVETGEFLYKWFTGEYFLGALIGIGSWLWDNILVPMWDDLKDVGAWVKDNIIIPAWEQWVGIGDWIKENIIIPGFIGMLNASDWIFDTFINPGWEIMKTVGQWIFDTFINPGWEYAKSFGLFSWDMIKAGWESIKDIGSWSWDMIKTGWEGLKNWGSRVWSMIRSAAGRLFGRGSGGSDDAPSKATGGNIRETSLYKLHAGERVTRAGENNESNESKTININNTFNIKAEISNDMDVRTLADRLAELNETELRRRVSYGGH